MAKKTIDEVAKEISIAMAQILEAHFRKLAKEKMGRKK